MSAFEQFLEKIKSLQIQTGKTQVSGLCKHCGKPMALHVLAAACIRRDKKQKQQDQEEQSFAV